MDSCEQISIELNDCMPVLREHILNGSTVRLSPRGTSMLPILREGKDAVILSAVFRKLKKYDLPLYRRDNGQYVLHRIIKVGDTYTCMGDNQFVPEHGLRKDQMIAMVTAYIRDGKTYSANDIRLQLYYRFWHYSRFIRRLILKVGRLLK